MESFEFLYNSKVERVPGVWRMENGNLRPGFPSPDGAHVQAEVSRSCCESNAWPIPDLPQYSRYFNSGEWPGNHDCFSSSDVETEVQYAPGLWHVPSDASTEDSRSPSGLWMQQPASKEAAATVPEQPDKCDVQLGQNFLPSTTQPESGISVLSQLGPAEAEQDSDEDFREQFLSLSLKSI